MRLFIAIEIPEQWREAARAARAALERELRDTGAGASLRWVDPALMHLTLRFLGEVAEDRLDALRRALDAGMPPVDVELALAAAGTFGPPARTNVVWLGVAGSADGLVALAERAEAAMVSAGLPPDRRPFRSHLTLARLGRNASRDDRRAVAAAVERLPEPPLSRFHAGSVALVRSHLGRGGPRYQVLSRHGLTAG